VTSDAGGRGGKAAEASTASGSQIDAERLPRSAFSLLMISLVAVLGIVGLTWLGIWQIERRAWKLDLIERVDARVHASPAAAPGPEAWPSINTRDDEYRRVTITGRFLHDRETLVMAVTEDGGGYWVLTPLKTANGLSGFEVLINRGFVPSDKKGREARAAGEAGGEVTVTGLMRMTEPKGAFLRANDISADRWFSRDVDAIAIKRGLDNYAPYFIDADATANPGGYPIGGLTVINFPNNHLVYALTWFALALMLCGAFIHFLREEMRVRRPPADGDRAALN
jgi:surfeit locus 1 family protein